MVSTPVLLWSLGLVSFVSVPYGLKISHRLSRSHGLSVSYGLFLPYGLPASYDLFGFSSGLFLVSYGIRVGPFRGLKSVCPWEWIVGERAQGRKGKEGKTRKILKR